MQNPTIEEYKASCVYKGDVLAGHLAFNPAGNLVQLPPGSVSVAASVEKGTYVKGLKDGFKLANQADAKKRHEENVARDAAKVKEAEAKAKK